MNIDDENKTKENNPDEVETEPVKSDWTFSNNDSKDEERDK